MIVRPFSRLPEGYTELEYIESSGTQYIDLGFKGNLNTEIELDFSILKWGNVNIANIAGDNTTSTVAINFNTGSNNGSPTARFGDKVISAYKGTLELNKRYTGSTNKNKFVLNNEEIGEFNTTTPFTTKNNILLFRANSSSYVGNVRLYSAKINNEKYIPAKRKSDNVLGMYNLVTDTFFTNAGTGTFIAGPKIEGITKQITIPEGNVNEIKIDGNVVWHDSYLANYERLNYLESSGTQYIDTLYNPIPSKMRIKFSFMQNDIPNTTMALLGTRDQSDSKINTSINIFQRVASGSSGFRTDMAEGNVIYHPIINGVVTECMIDLKNKNGYVGDSEILSFKNVISTRTKNSFKLFTFDTDGKFLFNHSQIKIYNFEMYEDDILVMNFIPSRRRIDGVLGMYDTITKQFFTNAGTGTFIGG